MANTFELIASSTVGVLGATSIDFTSIPSTYTDLCLKVSTRHNGASTANAMLMTFNSNTTGYTARFIEGAGSGTPSSSSVSARYGGLDVGASATSSTFSNTEIYIPNYAGSTNKSYSVDSVAENNATVGIQWLLAGLWSNTAAITSITLQPDNALRSYVQFSTAYLYGIKSS
jgi:hypothetical protein